MEITEIKNPKEVLETINTTTSYWRKLAKSLQLRGWEYMTDDQLEELLQF